MPEISDWTRNIINVDKMGKPGKCPICESNKTDYIITNNPASIKVWCDACDGSDTMAYCGTPPAVAVKDL